MAALKAVFEAQQLRPGDRVVMPGDGYGVTRLLFKQLCARSGVELHALMMTDPGTPARIAELRPRLVLAESVTNPLLRVPDIRTLARACKDVGAVLAVDGTFPSPYGQRSLALGADYAVQSATKWLNGHSDALAGTVSGSKERLAPLRSWRLLGGEVLGPFEAWLTLRGIRTLPVRMKAHCEHALHVARRLAESPLLDRVHYPGLPSHADHAVAQQVLENGFGGMVAFEIKGAGRPEGMRFLEALKVARPGPSLADVCTLVMHAASASARRMTPEEREAAGIRESLIRVSVGLEDPDDIAEDLLGAVAQVVKR
jgi:cystathionine beta-lyase/cystathionine gamma-synthase